MCRLFLEKLDCSFPERRLLGEAGYPKSGLRLTHDIHSTTFKPFNIGNACSHADAVNGLFGFFFRSAAKQYQTEGFSAIDTAVDHQLVPLFKDVERNGDIGKQDEIGKRKERDF